MMKKTVISATLGMALLGSVSALAAVTGMSTYTLPISVATPASTSFTFAPSTSLVSGNVSKGVVLGTFTVNGSNLTGSLALKPLGGTCDTSACTFDMAGTGSNKITASLDTQVNTGLLTSPADGVIYSQDHTNTMTARLTLASQQNVTAGSYTATVTSYNYVP